jgi:hypothetical protein
MNSRAVLSILFALALPLVASADYVTNLVALIDPAKLNSANRDKVGERQIDHGRKFHAAGLSSRRTDAGWDGAKKGATVKSRPEVEVCRRVGFQTAAVRAARSLR